VQYKPKTLLRGNYDVYINYVSGGNRASNVPVEVHHNNQYETVTVDQKVNGFQWVLIGTYYFTADGAEYVRIKNAGTTTANDGWVMADAVRFSRNTTAPEPEPGVNVNLNTLTVTPGALSPLFSAAVAGYTVQVGNSISSIGITATTSSPAEVTLAVNGTPTVTGSTYAAALELGLNEIVVTVTANDNSAQNSYTLLVNRALQASGDNTLNSLAISRGTLAPGFHPETTNYSIQAGYTTETITIIPTVSSEVYQALTVNGVPALSGSASTVSLALGVNNIPVTVTAEDGSPRTYSLHVARAEAVSTDADLSALFISAGAMSFDPAVTVYDVAVKSIVSTLEITPRASSTVYRNLTVNAAAVASDSSYTVNLAAGINEIPIVVTAEDNTTQRTYLLRITRALPAGETVGNTGLINPLLAPRISQAVMLYVGNGEGYVNNIRSFIDPELRLAKPFTAGAEVYVPLAYTVEGFGAATDLSGDGSILRVDYAGRAIVFAKDSNVIDVNGQPVILPAPIASKDDWLYASAETVAAVFEKELFQDDTGLVIFSDVPNLFQLPGDLALVREITDGFQYEWGNVRIYPGGFVTGMVIHPVEEDLMYVRTDVGGAYRWNSSSGQWVPLMDKFGLNELNLVGVDGIALSRTDSNVVYVAAGMYGNKSTEPHDVLKSTDRGQTWQRTNLNKRFYGNSTGTAGDQRLDGERIAVDPFNSSVVYVGTRYNGLWYTTDGAETWSKVTAVPNGTEPSGITNVEFDYSAGQTIEGRAKVIYIGVEGQGVYKSADGGSTWSATVSNLTAGPVYPRRMSVSSDGTLYVTSISSNNRLHAVVSPVTAPTNGVFKYDGAAWTNITPPASQGAPFGQVAVKPDDPDYLLAAEGYYQTVKIYASRDAGLTWSLKGDSYGASAQLLFNPHNPEEVYNLHGAGIHRTVNITTESINWIEAGNGIEELCALKMISLPNGRLIMGTLDRGGFVSTDRTIPAERLTSPLSSENTALDFCEEDPNFVFRLASSTAGATPRAAFSTDGGATWRELTYPYGIGGNVAVSSHKQANGFPLVVIWTNTHTPKLSRDFGQTWEDTLFAGVPAPVYTGTIFNSRRYGLDADRVAGDIFYLYDTVGGKFYTSTNGKSWSLEKTARLPSGSSNDIAGVRAAPYMAGEVWASNNKKGLYRSSDYGKTFTKLANVQEALMFAFGKNKPGRSNPAVYVYGRINNANGVFRSDDMGETWVRISHDAYQMANDPKSIAGDRNLYGQVYLGTGGRGVFYGKPVHTDDVPPKLTLEQTSSSSVPDAYYAVRNAEYLISGTVSEDGGLMINGTPYGEIQKGYFSRQITLLPGLNQITVAAVDGAGNTSDPAELAVRYDPTYAGISVLTAGGFTNQTPYQLRGRVNTTGTVRINGEQVPLQANLEFQAELPLTEGENTFAISFVSDMGEAAQPVAYGIVLDRLAPVLEVDEVPAASSTSYYLLTGMLSEDASLLKNGIRQTVDVDRSFETASVPAAGNQPVPD
jgi:photosystem II stability/assembly factor-like uncharacterized protein